MKQLIKLLLSIAITACCTSGLYAQVKIGNNPESIHSDAILEMETANKGMLLPRIALNATDDPAPLSAFTAGMTIYNTVTAGAGATAVSPGIYYSDGEQWVKAANIAPATGVQRVEYTAAEGQLEFETPSGITDINKISLYRNGVYINCTVSGPNTVSAEIACREGDNIKIVQQL